jgi:hypothetical protein
MWRTDTYWFDVAVVLGLLTLGTILFGRFEEHKPHGAERAFGKVLSAVLVALGLELAI